MKKVYDIAVVFVLLLLLVIGFFIDNAIIRGVLLLLFSAVLTGNTIVKFAVKLKGNISGKVLYGILLFLEFLLLVSAFYVTITAIIEA